MGDQVPGRGVGRHWVVIETGANQAFVFASNKQAVNVGASQLIWQMGNAWVGESIAHIDGDEKVNRRIEPVVNASGKALLLVDSEDTGRAVIRAVTTRALDEAPGLEVSGVVDSTPIVDDSDVGLALARAHRLQEAWRSRRPSTQLRFPTLPFTQLCHYSGQPATELELEGDRWYPRAASIAKAWAARNAGRDRMASLLNGRAVVRLDRLADGVTHAGWVAVVHADGNGIGEIFRSLADVYAGDEFLDRLGAFSKALDDVSVEALRRAVHGQPDRTDWILPLVVGGDDMTAVMDARVAFDVTVRFLREFAELSAANDLITEVVGRVRRHLAEAGATTVDSGHPVGLTACAGIAYVKPHFPFSEAYDLAKNLSTSAKRVKQMDARCGALDFQVLHDSIGRDLKRVRESLAVLAADGGVLRLWAAGPRLTTNGGYARR
jgi:hypothetical protein